MTRQQPTNRIERAARLRWVRLGDIRINPLAQREFRQHWADSILAKFDPDRMQPHHVNQRDGHWYCVDGQHSFDAEKRWLGEGWEDQQSQCWTYEGLTSEEEADLYLYLNNRKSPDVFSSFRIAVHAGREVQCDIDRVVRAQELVISRDNIDGAIGAVGTLERVYARSGPGVLARALGIIRDAYGNAGFEGAVIDGISLLCDRYNGELDRAKAVKQLSNAHGGVKGLLNSANDLRYKTGNKRSHCVAAAAVATINRGKGKKLPSWWKSET